MRGVAMRAAWISWLIVCVLAAAGFASAATPSAVPEATSLLVDQAAALTESERAAGRNARRVCIACCREVAARASFS